MVIKNEEKFGVLLMADGSQKKINDIEIGDRIRSLNNTARVDNIWKELQIVPVIRLMVDSKELLLTKYHPVQTDKGMIPAYELQEGTKVLTQEHGYVAITQIDEELCTDWLSKFDIHLESEDKLDQHIMFESGIAVGDYIIENYMEDIIL
ncbi:hypothetical protein [Anaerosporobacter sp.]